VREERRGGKLNVWSSISSETFLKIRDNNIPLLAVSSPSTCGGKKIALMSLAPSDVWPVVLISRQTLHLRLAGCEFHSTHQRVACWKRKKYTAVGRGELLRLIPLPLLLVPLLFAFIFLGDMDPETRKNMAEGLATG
jgi:hypothetical protein